MPEAISLQYPIVFVHGVGGHDRTGRKKAWGRIPEILKAWGIQVFPGSTDAWGNYQSNAAILKKNIEAILLETGKEKVNIIGHSKGGIDARYLIWEYDFGGRVASLTTICTPHLGSEIADMLYRRKIIHTQFVQKGLALYGRLYGGANPDLYAVNSQLTSASMKEFNAKVLPDERVFYQSLYTTVDSVFNDIRFAHSYLYIKKVRGKSDGVVSEHSTKWGSAIACLGSGISHAEILDKKEKKISGVHIPDIYVNIVKGLSEKNF